MAGGYMLDITYIPLGDYSVPVARYSAPRGPGSQHPPL